MIGKSKREKDIILDALSYRMNGVNEDIKKNKRFIKEFYSKYNEHGRGRESAEKDIERDRKLIEEIEDILRKIASGIL